MSWYGIKLHSVLPSSATVAATFSGLPGWFCLRLPAHSFTGDNTGEAQVQTLS
jgi:hypothetical protein